MQYLHSLNKTVLNYVNSADGKQLRKRKTLPELFLFLFISIGIGLSMFRRYREQAVKVSEKPEKKAAPKKKTATKKKAGDK